MKLMTFKADRRGGVFATTDPGLADKFAREVAEGWAQKPVEIPAPSQPRKRRKPQ